MGRRPDEPQCVGLECTSVGHEAAAASRYRLSLRSGCAIRQLCMAASLPLKSPRAEHEPEKQLQARYSHAVVLKQHIKKHLIKKRIYSGREVALTDIMDNIDTARRHIDLGGLRA
jgi:hypothetical protein